MAGLDPDRIAGPEQFDEMVGILGDVLAEAWDEYTKGRPKVAATATAKPEVPL